MSLDSISVWQDAFADLPLVSTPAWKTNLADYLGDLLDDKLNLSTYVSPPAGGKPNHPYFLFGRAAFAASLTDVNGIVGLQSAFNAGVTASTWTIPIGSAYGAQTPAETFSTIGVAVVVPASIASGQGIIATLSGAPLVSDATASDFPVKLRDAFLALTYNVTGTNSVAPTPGPINDLARGVA